MRHGYLIVESHPDHPGLVRVAALDQWPTGPATGHQSPAQTHYVVLFADIGTALMHAHTALRRHLVDIDTRLYQADPVFAVAAVSALELPHRPIYLDPGLIDSPALAEGIAQRQRRYRRNDRAWNLVGILAILFLLLKLAVGF